MTLLASINLSLTHLRKVSIQREQRSLFAMTENTLFSVLSLLHFNKIETLLRLGELSFSCNGADVDSLCAPFDMSLWKALDARAHQLFGKPFRALNVDIFHSEVYPPNGIIMISRNLPQLQESGMLRLGKADPYKRN